MIQFVIYFQQCYFIKTNLPHKCLNTINENLTTQVWGHVTIEQCSCTLHSILLHKHLKVTNTNFTIQVWGHDIVKQCSCTLHVIIFTPHVNITFNLSWQITLHNNLVSSQQHDIPFRLWIQGSDDTHIKNQMLRIYHIPKYPKTLLALTNEALLIYIWLINFKS